MSAFTVSRESPLGVQDAWAAVSDLRAHGDVVPLTRMVLDEGEPRVGWGFSAGTALGPLTLWDHMLVTQWTPPTATDPRGRLHIVKTGRWLGGWARITVEPAGAGSRVEWTEQLYPALDPFPRLTGPLARRLGARLFGATLTALLTTAEGRA